MVQKFNLKIGETYIMGDSPLVLLTALQSSFEADPSSSSYVIKTLRKSMITDFTNTIRKEGTLESIHSSIPD